MIEYRMKVASNYCKHSLYISLDQLVPLRMISKKKEEAEIRPSKARKGSSAPQEVHVIAVSLHSLTLILVNCSRLSAADVSLRLLQRIKNVAEKHPSMQPGAGGNNWQHTVSSW